MGQRLSDSQRLAWLRLLRSENVGPAIRLAHHGPLRRPTRTRGVHRAGNSARPRARPTRTTSSSRARRWSRWRATSLMLSPPSSASPPAEPRRSFPQAKTRRSPPASRNCPERTRPSPGSPWAKSDRYRRDHSLYRGRDAQCPHHLAGARSRGTPATPSAPARVSGRAVSRVRTVIRIRPDWPFRRLPLPPRPRSESTAKTYLFDARAAACSRAWTRYGRPPSAEALGSFAPAERDLAPPFRFDPPLFVSAAISKCPKRWRPRTRVRQSLIILSLIAV